MGFFERNRNELTARGIDVSRLPPGQYHTDRFPVLHVGDVPHYDMDTWTFQVFGLVEREVTLSWDELLAMPQVDVVTDLHCVTKWSKFDTGWRGVRIADILALAELTPDAAFVQMYGDHGYTANLPLADVLVPHALLAHTFDSAPLEPDHGAPLRTLVPHLYLWKSVKWARAIEVLAADAPGFWEQNGYHQRGDPWSEQRFWER